MLSVCVCVCMFILRPVYKWCIAHAQKPMLFFLSFKCFFYFSFSRFVWCSIWFPSVMNRITSYIVGSKSFLCIRKEQERDRLRIEIDRKYIQNAHTQYKIVLLFFSLFPFVSVHVFLFKCWYSCFVFLFVVFAFVVFCVLVERRQELTR